MHGGGLEGLASMSLVAQSLTKYCTKKYKF